MDLVGFGQHMVPMQECQYIVQHSHAEPAIGGPALLVYNNDSLLRRFARILHPITPKSGIWMILVYVVGLHKTLSQAATSHLNSPPVDRERRSKLEIRAFFRFYLRCHAHSFQPTAKVRLPLDTARQTAGGSFSLFLYHLLQESYGTSKSAQGAILTTTGICILCVGMTHVCVITLFGDKSD